jgi:hypothetical protein
VEVTGRRSLIDRMIGAALLKIDVYEEVEHDESATGQAAIAVGLVAIASGIASWTYGGTGMIAGVVSAYYKLFKGTATWGELLRTLGFAQSPGVLFVIGAIPVIGLIVFIPVAIWIVIAVIIAIRQALDITTGKAVVTAVLGMLLAMLINGLINKVLGIG